jgi:poly(3-hydroxybutyrate) depolymerase
MKSLLLGSMLAFAAAVCGQTLPDGKRPLAEILKKYPQADANKDGLLTEEEALAYRAKFSAQRKTAQPGSDNAPVPAFADVAYGPHERNRMDVYPAEGPGPHPVLLLIHGGGFVGGSKEKFRTDSFVWEARKKGITLVAINYRFVSTDPFPAPFLDGARAVQFIRSKAAEWNIDPARIGAYGGSAGGNISVWLATHDDLAEPKSSDPVARQSTRLSCVLGNNAQTFNDPVLILKTIGGNPDVHSSLMKAAGIESMKQADEPHAREIAHNCSAINFVTPDDPPLYLAYNSNPGGTPLPADTPQGKSIHHPLFGILMQTEYRKLGLECVVTTPDSAAAAPDRLEWLAARLAGKSGKKKK